MTTAKHFFQAILSNQQIFKSVKPGVFLFVLFIKLNAEHTYLPLVYQLLRVSRTVNGLFQTDILWWKSCTSALKKMHLNASEKHYYQVVL